MIYQLFASPKKKTQNPQQQAIENRKAQQIKKISQDLQKAGGIGKLDSQQQFARKGTINHHRQIIEQRKKKLASKQKQPEEAKDKKNYLPSAKKGQLFFDPFAKGTNKSKYNINEYEKQKTQANSKVESVKVENQQASIKIQNNQKTIVSSPVQSKEVKKSQILSKNQKIAANTEVEQTPKKKAQTVAAESSKKNIQIYSENKVSQKTDYQTLYSRNKPNSNTPNPNKARQEKVELNINVKTPSKSVKQLKLDEKIIENEKMETSNKFKRTNQAKSIYEKSKTQVNDKNQKFIKASQNIKPVQLIQVNKIQQKQKVQQVQSPKYSEVVKKQEFKIVKFQDQNTQAKNSEDFPKLWNNTKPSYKRSEIIKQEVSQKEQNKMSRETMNSPQSNKKDNKQIQLFFDPFRKKQTRGPILNAQSPKNQINEKPKSNKKDQKLNASCDKQQKRQNEAQVLRIQNEQKRKKQQALKDEQTRKKAAQIAAENQKKRLQAIQLAKKMQQKKNQKQIQNKKRSVTTVAKVEQKKIQNNYQNIYNRSQEKTIMKQETKAQEKKNIYPSKSDKNLVQQASTIKTSIISSQVQKNKQATINTSPPKKNVQLPKSNIKNAVKIQQELKSVQIKEQPVSMSQATPVKKRHNHQFRQGSLRKSVNRNPQSLSPVKQMIQKQKLIQSKHSHKESITNQEYADLMNRISHLQEYIQFNQQQLFNAHNDIARKKQMLEDARQQIMEKNRLIMQLKSEDHPQNVIMPERFSYWSLDQNVFYKSRDPVGQIVQQRRRAARQSRLINHEILSHSHYRIMPESRSLLKEEINDNAMLRNAKSQGLFKLSLSHQRQMQNQQENSIIDGSRMSTQRFNENSLENSQFYIELLERLKSRVFILKRQNEALQRGLIIR